MSDTQALKSLHTTLVDAEKGYVTATQDAKAPDMKSLFSKMSSLHARAHSDLHAILRAKGEEADESGSFLSLVHKTVISVRSAVTGLDSSALPSFIDGEERILGAYDRAIAQTPEAEFQATLQSDRSKLVAAIDEMRAKAA